DRVVQGAADVERHRHAADETDVGPDVDRHVTGFLVIDVFCGHSNLTPARAKNEPAPAPRRAPRATSGATPCGLAFVRDRDGWCPGASARCARPPSPPEDRLQIASRGAERHSPS